MILARVRQVPAVGSLPRLLALTGVNTGVVLGVFHMLAAIDRRTPGLPVLLGVVWLAFALWMAFGRVHVRCTPFDLSLPLSARRLWGTHLLTLLVAGALIIAFTAALVLGLGRLIEGYLGFSSGGDANPLRMMILLGVGLVLTVVVVESPKPELAALPITRGYVLLLVTTLVAVLGLLLVLAALPLAWALVPLAAAVALGVRSYRAVPGSFALVPAAPEAGGGSAPGAAAAAAQWRHLSDRQRSSLPLLVRTIHSHPKKGPMGAWIITPFLMVLGLAYGGMAFTLTGDDFIRFFWIPMGTYMLLVAVGQMCRQLFPVDPLPVSRRRLFALVVAPSVLAVVLGYGAGKVATATLAPRHDLIEYPEVGTHDYFVRVPAGWREIAWDGQLPEITSPWGESHTALGGPPFAGSPIVLYSPFSTPEGSSAEFVALQMSRAMAAIYGAEVPPSELRERYLEVRDDGKVGLKAGGFHLLADYPHLRPPGDEGPVFPVIMALLGVPFFLLLAVVLLTLRASVPAWVNAVLFWSLVGLVLLSTGAPIALAAADLIDLGAVKGLVDVFIRHAGQTVAGTLAVWGGSALLLAGAYRLAEKAFARVEMPISVKCGLV